MKNLSITIAVLLLTAQFSFSQKQEKPLTLIEDYTELSDTKPIDREAWKKTPATPQLSWGSTDIRYNKMNVPDIKNTTTWKADAWKGERVNAQAVLWSSQSLKGINVEVSDLKSGNSVIPSASIRTNFVRFVMTDELSKDRKTGCGHRPDRTQWDSSIVADALDMIKIRDLEACTTQPVWVNIWVPQSVKAGKYAGTLTVKAEGIRPMQLKLEVNVLNHTLPEPKKWAYHLDLWQNPFSVARYYNLPLWSPEHFEAMRPTIQTLADAGQKIITTTIMHEPWGGQTQDYFETMVTRIKKIDGTWAFDYAVFDKWVEFMMSMGIDEQINCYSLIPWKLSFQYFDQASNTLKFIDTKPGEAAYNDYWLDFLKSFASHLKQKGWWEKTTIGMDERPMEAMQQAIALIKKADPAYKISLAGNYHSEIEKDLYDYCIAFGNNFPADVKNRRQSEGKISTYYTCCAEPFPNTFTFSLPAEATWMGWHAAGGNYDGYLRWAYNSWTLDPLRDSRFRTWAAGDCYLVYPGGRSSIRMERLIEGIQDFEKIRILRNELEQQGNTGKLAKLNQMVSSFNSENFVKQGPTRMVTEARKLLNSL